MDKSTFEQPSSDTSRPLTYEEYEKKYLNRSFAELPLDTLKEIEGELTSLLFQAERVADSMKLFARISLKPDSSIINDIPNGASNLEKLFSDRVKRYSEDLVIIRGLIKSKTQ